MPRQGLNEEIVILLPQPSFLIRRSVEGSKQTLELGSSIREIA